MPHGAICGLHYFVSAEGETASSDGCLRLKFQQRRASFTVPVPKAVVSRPWNKFCRIPWGKGQGQLGNATLQTWHIQLQCDSNWFTSRDITVCVYIHSSTCTHFKEYKKVTPAPKQYPAFSKVWCWRVGYSLGWVVSSRASFWRDVDTVHKWTRNLC